MRKELIVKIGGELVKMEKVSYRIFRKIDTRGNSKWLCYFDGQNYYRFLKETNLIKISEQIKLFLAQEMTFVADNFCRDFGFWGIYFYNNSLRFKVEELPEILKSFKNALRTYIKEDRILILPDFDIEYKKEDFRGKRQNIITGRGRDFLFYWLTQVFEDRIKVLECEAPSCLKIFIPTRKSGKNRSRFCSENCRGKTYIERKKKKILSKILI